MILAMHRVVSFPAAQSANEQTGSCFIHPEFVTILDFAAEGTSDTISFTAII